MANPQVNTIVDESVPAGQPWARIIDRGQRLRIIDVHGHQGVDFLCYNAHAPEERYHAPNTLKAAGTLHLTRGHVLYSDVARPMFTITAMSNCPQVNNPCNAGEPTAIRVVVFAAD